MKPTVQLWGITDGSAGMISQVRGVGEQLAEAIDGQFTLKSCRRTPPFCWLPGWAALGALRQLTPNSDRLQAPWPDVLITSGRRSAALSVAIKKASAGKTRTVHLQDPRIDPKYFDLVFPMAHDGLDGANVHPTEMALHSLTPEKIAMQAAKWQSQLAHFPSPRVAALIGGSTNKYQLRQPAINQMLAQLNDIQQSGAGLIITTSRRTGTQAVEQLKAQLAHREAVFFYDGQGENPYPAMLGLADIIVVTNDSASMMSEAASTEKTLYILGMQGHTSTKPAQFADHLIAKGIARKLTLPLEQWGYSAPNERQQVVEKIISACLPPDTF